MSELGAIQLGQRLTSLLNFGRRQTTYKLATLLALIDVCTESLPDDSDDTLEVSIIDLADRVIEYYWQQVEPYTIHGVLLQGRTSSSDIPNRIRTFKEVHTLTGNKTLSAPTKKSADYEKLRRKVAHTLAKMPLRYLQTSEWHSGPRDDFLFDSSWLVQKDATLEELDKHNWSIVLNSSVAWNLAAIAPLIRPVIELQWLQDINDFNQVTLEKEDLAGFMFGSTRTSLVKLGPSLTDSQSGKCFYCSGKLSKTDLEIDHVIPFSRIPLNGLSNLVAADRKCNNVKRATLPIWGHVDRALSRDIEVLQEIEASQNWPILLTRTKDSALGVYKLLPQKTQLWVSLKTYDYSQVC